MLTWLNCVCAGSDLAGQPRSVNHAGKERGSKLKKVYCEHGALTKELRNLGRRGSVRLVHFPYDRDSYMHLDVATASKAKIQDLNLPIKDLPGTLPDYAGSANLKEIFAIINGSNRQDALHIDSAFKDGCSAFVTRDNDILDHRAELESLLKIKFFHPNEWAELTRFLVDSGAASL